MGNACWSDEMRKASTKDKQNAKEIQKQVANLGLEMRNSIKKPVFENNYEELLDELDTVTHNITKKKTQRNTVAAPSKLTKLSKLVKSQRLNNLRQRQISHIKQQANNRKLKRRNEQNLIDNQKREPYSQQKQIAIIHTIETLAKEEDRLSNHLEKYDYSEIRKFNEACNWNHQLAAKRIVEDIEWRERMLPIRTVELLTLLKSEQIFFQGSDKYMCPCIYIKPNQEPQERQCPQIKDYFKFFIYILEEILPLLFKKEKYSEKLTVLIDMQKQDFRIDILEIMEDLMIYHYPQRLNKILIVNINLEKITQKIQSKFQQQFYKNNILLLDENYQVTLMKYFDPTDLRKEYGGEAVSYQNQAERLLEYQNVQDFIINEFRNQSNNIKLK